MYHWESYLSPSQKDPPFMSDFMLSQVQNTLNSVTADIHRLSDTNSQMEVILDAIDDLAANLLALNAVVGVLAQKQPVALAEAEEWLRNDLKARDGVIPDKAHFLLKTLTGHTD